MPSIHETVLKQLSFKNGRRWWLHQVNISEIVYPVKFVFFFIFIINFYTTEYITGKKYLKLVFETSDRTRFGLYRFFYTNLAFELKRFFS